jgi:hypothetical protein
MSVRNYVVVDVFERHSAIGVEDLPCCCHREINRRSRGVIAAKTGAMEGSQLRPGATRCIFGVASGCGELWRLDSARVAVAATAITLNKTA